jgi:hypothetical protein
MGGACRLQPGVRGTNILRGGSSLHREDKRRRSEMARSAAGYPPSLPVGSAGFAWDPGRPDRRSGWRPARVPGRPERVRVPARRPAGPRPGSAPTVPRRAGRSIVRPDSPDRWHPPSRRDRTASSQRWDEPQAPEESIETCRRRGRKPLRTRGTSNGVTVSGERRPHASMQSQLLNPHTPHILYISPALLCQV